MTGGASDETNDVFEKARIDVLFNFTIFFFVTSVPYLILSLSMSLFHVGMSVIQVVGYIGALVMFRLKRPVRSIAFFFLANYTIQIFAHYLLDSGRIEAVGLLFFVLYVLCFFMLLGQKWGWGIAIFVMILFALGIYNRDSGYSLFHFPEQYADPESTAGVNYMMMIPVLLNFYLVSEFVKARNKAEDQINDQRLRLEEKNKDITDSINYASRLQRSQLPSEKYIGNQLSRLNKK
jgi:hypothetical protein